MPSPVRKVARFQCLSWLVNFTSDRTLFPPTESWLVNSNFPLASRMQGHVTTKIFQSGYEPLNLVKSDVHATLMPSTWGFNPKEVKRKWKPTDIVKVPISSKFLFSHQILNFMQWTLAKKVFDLDEKRFYNESLKTSKSYFLAVYPCRWSHDRHAQNSDVDSGTANLRLDFFRLSYLCKFT